MQTYSDRTVYITGGSAGIGLAAAQRFAALGAHILLLARRKEPLEEAVAALETSRITEAQRFQYRQLDMADGNQVREILGNAVTEFGGPDVLINNAGRARPDYFENITHEQLEETFKLNVFGAWNAIQAVLPHMKAHGGYIVNVSSLAGLIGVFGFTDYCASKFALIGLSEALRSELKRHKIMVSVLCPPDTDTPGLEQENQGKPAETKAISATAKILQADDVAKALIQGMRKRRPIIIAGLDGKLAYLLKRWCPLIVEKTMDRAVRNASKTRDTHRPA